MNWKTKQRIGYVLVTIVFAIIVLVHIWQPGIPVLSVKEMEEKLGRRIGKVLDPQARITFLHLDGFGASRKFRYAIISYRLPADEQLHTVSLYVDGTGKSFDGVPRSSAGDGVYEDGLLLTEMDFKGVSDNLWRIHEELKEEGKEWMGVAEYIVRLDPESRDFVHETKVYYEIGPTLLKWVSEYYLGVTPSQSLTYTIRDNGTGPLELK